MSLTLQLSEFLSDFLHACEFMGFEQRHELLDRNRDVVKLRFKGGNAARVLPEFGIVDAGGGDDVNIVHDAGENKVLQIEIVEVAPVRASVPCVCGIARQVVRPRPDAVLSRLVLGGVVIAHCGATHRTACQFLEEIRELLALPTALAFLSKESHILNTVKRRTVDDLGVVARDDFLPHAAFLGLEFSNVFTNNGTIAQELVDVALMPNSRPRVPGQDALLAQSPSDDPAPVAAHIHVENAADELCAVFVHMNFAVVDFEPTRHLARHDDAFLRQLALRLPVRARSE
ncbi:hypothetical protein [Desulfovibrio sp.]|uniref:hypothetical protein n=1 Tax=Desulfovibrio sp. TaxID=885 RepID=UPI002D1FAE0D|nr:hypothetical protein [Desulfovibrio sp.]